jgi:hypothetical protein
MNPPTVELSACFPFIRQGESMRTGRNCVPACEKTITGSGNYQDKFDDFTEKQDAE